ncbi:hypothetical protein [Nocardia sp. NBC_01327]|uniref:hypothetical protein n=1 Tax=Nocardia sp. NBC_01327 TaxID=2903593 RepID=UPI002E1270D7|nr:hypothetical protein OG326_25325 [Nocardia sp. NBC_01327]
MVTDHTSGLPAPGFTVEDVSVGHYAHGFGVTADGRPFAFRTVRGLMTVEIYRPDLQTDVPAAEDVVAIAESRLTDIDLEDERSIIALVRDLIPHAVAVSAAPAREAITVRALLARLGAVIDNI